MMKLSKIILAAAVLGVAGCASHRPAPVSATTATAAVQYPVITKLVGRHQTIVISAGPSTPVYSVQSPAGQIIVAYVTLQELRDKHPEYYQFVQPARAEVAAFEIADVN